MITDVARYAGQVIVVTGATKGIGRLLADYFLAQDARVIGVSRGETDLVHAAYEHHLCDIADDRSVQALFVAIARSHGRVDIVINNAAVLTSIHAMLMPARRSKSWTQPSWPRTRRLRLAPASKPSTRCR